MGLTIKDAPLVENVADEIKFPVSDGSDKPKAASVGQIGEHIRQILVQQIVDILKGYVKKVEGKDLSTNDFTNDLKNKLDALSNYDDTEIQVSVSKLRADLDTLVSGDTTTAIKTFNEVIAFLDGIRDTEDLSGIIASIELQIAAKAGKSEIPTKVSQLKNDSDFVKKEDVDVPDEEDITSVDNKLKFKNRKNLNGMGYVILRKNKLFSEQLTQTNTIYEIRYDFDLDGDSITIPSDSTLKFEGGSIKNGNVLFDNTTLSGEPYILTNIILGSTIRNSIIYLDWFGGIVNDVNADCANAFENIGKIKADIMPEIRLKAGIYYSSSFKCPPFATISGAGSYQTIIKAKSSGLSYEYSGVQTNDLFIAVYQPKTKIADLTIDGGELEGYDNVGIGSYQTGFLLMIERCRFINCSKGALLINSIGSGIFNILHNEFICSGDDYCININSSVDHVSIQDNDFENINKPNASIIKSSNNYSGMNIRVIGNRFENVLAKHYIELKALSLASIIAFNKYFGNNGEFDDNASVYKIDSTAYQLQIYNDNIWGINIPHYLIAGENAVVVFDKMNMSPSNIYYGYYNENGNFVSLSTLPPGKPRAIIMTTEGISYYPSQSEEYKTMFPNYSQIGALFLYPEGATRVIDTNSDAVSLRIRCNNLVLRKNNIDYPLTDLFQNRNGDTSNRPTSPVQGSVYFDTTIKKPIWWTGTNWVDATGTDV